MSSEHIPLLFGMCLWGVVATNPFFTTCPSNLWLSILTLNNNPKRRMSFLCYAWPASSSLWTWNMTACSALWSSVHSMTTVFLSSLSPWGSWYSKSRQIFVSKLSYYFCLAPRRFVFEKLQAVMQCLSTIATGKKLGCCPHTEVANCKSASLYYGFERERAWRMLFKPCMTTTKCKLNCYVTLSSFQVYT